MTQTTKVYPKGLAFFKPREGAPDFVIGELIITPKEFLEWLNQNKEFLTTSEKYGQQMKFTLTDKGIQVNTWKPSSQN